MFYWSTMVAIRLYTIAQKELCYLLLVTYYHIHSYKCTLFWYRQYSKYQAKYAIPAYSAYVDLIFPFHISPSIFRY